MLISRHPFRLSWGPDLTYLYNDPYKSIIGGKHSDALRQPFRVLWRELLDVAGPQADNVIHRNEGTRALREGFDAHLVQPVNLDELFRVIAGRRK